MPRLFYALNYLHHLFHLQTFSACNVMTVFRSLFYAVVLMLAIGPTSQAQSLLPTTELTINGIMVQAELATTNAAHQRGLMHRTKLPPNHGMLFVFKTPVFQCFWMKNTPLPLSIAFIDAGGTITRIADMTPHDEAAHCPPGDIAYALEMEQGWFRQYNIQAGASVQGLPSD